MSNRWNAASPLQFEDTATIARSPAEVFDMLADFENLPRWMPFIRRVDVEQEPDHELPTRVVYPLIGPRTRERLLAIERPERLVYSASDETLHGLFTQHRGVVLCESYDDRQTLVRWQTFAQAGRVPIIRTVGPLVVRWFVRRSLINLKRLLESE